ncbi:hypothetical protein BJ878DRAFT_502661 [Calycina marina]|uniref:Uncharacterized protein n=1 Tax=Calycina marina TaxID=1763456 RepID=A0A9P8CFI7_9HELO|nr:hypothetical protein BJ878DRAFT_502661 [Calycina marina]
MEELQNRVEELKDDYRSLALDASNIRMEKMDLQLDNKKLQNEIARLQSAFKIFQSANDKAQFEQEQKIQLLESQVAELQGTISSHETQATNTEYKVRDCLERVKQLEEEVALKDPFYQVGVLVRARYLENAKFLMLTTRQLKGSYYKRYFKISGDAAAHSAMGATDKLLFNTKVLPASSSEPLLATFHALYRCPPTAYDTFTPSFHATIDCESTIKTIVVLNTNLRPLKEREMAMINIDFICTRYASLGAEAFEADAVVAQRLKWLKELTATILRMDHRRSPETPGGGGGRRGGYAVYTRGNM